MMYLKNEWITAWFVACWYKFKKPKSYFNNYWTGLAKNVPDLSDPETMYLTNDLMNWAELIELFLRTEFSDWIIIGLTTNLLWIF